MTTSSMHMPQATFNGFASSLNYSDVESAQFGWISRLNWTKLSAWTAVTLFNFASWYVFLKLVF